jgi:hypothetical protein
MLLLAKANFPFGETELSSARSLVLIFFIMLAAKNGYGNLSAGG